MITVKDGVLSKVDTEDENLIIPNTVKIIESNAIQNNTKIKTIILPNSIKSIKPMAINNLLSLTKITIDNSEINEQVSETECVLEKNGINNCPALTRIELPNGIKVIENKAINNCESLMRIVLPINLKVLDLHFYLRESKQNFYQKIPTSVKSLTCEQELPNSIVYSVEPESSFKIIQGMLTQNGVVMYHNNSTCAILTDEIKGWRIGCFRLFNGLLKSSNQNIIIKDNSIIVDSIVIDFYDKKLTICRPVDKLSINKVYLTELNNVYETDISFLTGTVAKFYTSSSMKLKSNCLAGLTVMAIQIDDEIIIVDKLHEYAKALGKEKDEKTYYGIFEFNDISFWKGFLSLYCPKLCERLTEKEIKESEIELKKVEREEIEEESAE